MKRLDDNNPLWIPLGICGGVVGGGLFAYLVLSVLHALGWMRP